MTASSSFGRPVPAGQALVSNPIVSNMLTPPDPVPRTRNHRFP
jgi:hypothetical protein